MSKDTLYDLNIDSPAIITDEQYTNVGSGIFKLGTVKRGFKGEADVVIRTASGGGGDLLIEGVDYEITNEDFEYTAKCGYHVYTGIRVLTTGYQTGNLYVSYKAVGSYTAADSINQLLSIPTLSLYSITNRLRKNGSANEVIVPKFRIELNGIVYSKSTETTLSTANLDTGSSFVFGSDYYVWAGVPSSGYDPVLKISLSATSPAGMTNPKIIGGFHYGKIRNSITASDVSDGILSNSCWDLQHMPKCYLLGLADPSTYQIGGMAEVVKNLLWVDIYLASDGGGSNFDKRVVSKINILPLTGTEGLSWYDFVHRGKNVGKRLLDYAEWVQAAIGSPQGLDGSNLNGWTKTTNTARVKTAATASGDADSNYILGYNISFANIRDCVGNVWEWLNDLSNRHDTTSWAWQNVLDAGELSSLSDFGQAYLPNNTGLIAYLAGGHWADGVRAGSRAVFANNYPWHVPTYIGARFACDSL